MGSSHVRIVSVRSSRSISGPCRLHSYRERRPIRNEPNDPNVSKGVSMCDLNHHHTDFGFIVDVPEIRALIDETHRLSRSIPDNATRVEALRPAFARLLATDGWLPDEFARPDHASGMGGGVGQYALYRDEAGALCLFSLVVPAGASTPVHDH